MRRLIHAALVAVLALGIPGMAWGKHRHGPGCGHRGFEREYRYSRRERNQYQRELDRERRYFYRQYHYLNGGRP